MKKELNVYTIWRWRLNGEWSIEARELLFANIALVFSYSPENLEEFENEDSMIRSSINHLVESLCLKNGFANPYEHFFYRFEHNKNAMLLSNDEYFDWKWPYALNKMLLTRGEDDLSRYLYDCLIRTMRECDLSLSYYYGYYCYKGDFDDYGYGFGLLTSGECSERPVSNCRRIDIKPQESGLDIGEVQTVTADELFKNVVDDPEPCIYKTNLKDYIKEISGTDIKHKDINLIKDRINTKQVIINNDFSIRVPIDAENTETSVFKNDNKGMPEWKMEFSRLDAQDDINVEKLATLGIIHQIPDYDEAIANDYVISDDDFSGWIMGNQTMEETPYYILHSFPKFGTGKVDISLSDAMAFDNKIPRCYCGIITLHSGKNSKRYKVSFEGNRITRSVDVIDLFGEMLRNIQLKDEGKTLLKENKNRTLRYSSCAFNFAMDVPETRFAATLDIEDGKDIR